MTKKLTPLSEQLMLAVKSLEDKRKKLSQNKIRKANDHLRKAGKEVGLEIEVKQIRSKGK